MLVFVVILSRHGIVVNAYHYGEVIDADYVINGVRTDTLRNQSPQFGIQTSAKFINPNDETTKTIVYLTFEDGLWYTSSTDASKFNHITITFVYSGSSIHSVSSISKANAKRNNKNMIYVDYMWVKEDSANIQYGQAMMFFIMIVSSVMILILSCWPTSKDNNNSNLNMANNNSNILSSSSAPKWD